MKVFFEDASLIVIDKPENLLSVASEAESEKTAYFQLTDYLRQGRAHAHDRVWIVHRLDRETSGLMIFAKTAAAKQSLQAAWDQAEKRYEAVVEGRVGAESGVFESDLDETNPFKVHRTAPNPQTRLRKIIHRKQKRPGKQRTMHYGRRYAQPRPKDGQRAN
jgi:23S rRNA-/tRNA-specific pseudouridylate synthase